MTITSFAVGAAVTPTVIKTYISHFTNRGPRRQKPTAHISYDEGLHLIRTFLKFASHHTVEDLQAFTSQWVPSPSWVRTENVSITSEYTSKAAKVIIDQLGTSEVELVGGSQWWQWRPKGVDLKAEWIEMRAHYNEQKTKGTRSRRIMLYVHGGGYFFGSVDEHRYQMQRHARKLKARVFAPRYRLAPQFPFPCGLQDCLAAYLYLLSMHDPTDIILAGDSAGGGMVVSMLCTLRDQGLPLPAGAILISPWVDLTHSFPSLTGSDEMDYIPPYGFMQKPSASWPPPNEKEVSIISDLAKGKDVGTKMTASAADLATDKISGESGQQQKEENTIPAIPIKDDGGIKPATQLYLSVDLGGARVIIKDQIQMYTTNQLLSHPLVSPVMQPSLGGLPPTLILTGGGEILRDEQIYLAHKMANPAKYPLGAEHKSIYDPDGAMLERYKPTPVQLQVWEDLCHVAPTLSFTRPAKYMYRSIAQFGAWVLARAQRRAIEIVDDDNISVISTQSGSDSEPEAEVGSLTDSMAKPKLDPGKATGSVGRAGDPLPPFENNMLRQKIDRYGRIYPLADAHDLPALQMAPDEVGVIKPGPVRKWLEARKMWDEKYTHARRRVQKERIKALASGEIKGFEGGEHPPPSALAGRRTAKDVLLKKKKKSYGLAMWSMWGSKHDESTLKREEEAEAAEMRKLVEEDQAQAALPEDTQAAGEPVPEPVVTAAESRPTPTTSPRPSHTRQRSASSRRRPSQSIPRGRSRTTSVTDRGQAEGRDVPPQLPPLLLSAPMAPIHQPEITTNVDQQSERATSPNPSLLSAGFIPKFKTVSHLREDSGGQIQSDAASTMTGRSGLMPDDASTRAVFAAPGVIKSVDPAKQQPPEKLPGPSMARPGSPLAYETHSLVSDGASVDDRDGVASIDSGTRSGVGASASRGRHGAGYDTPRSQRSLDRLQSHQQDEGMGRLEPLRSPSSTAIVRAEGIVGVVDADTDQDQDPEGEREEGGEDEDGTKITAARPQKEKEKESQVSCVGGPESERPRMYERTDTQFKTAVEQPS